MAKLSAKPKIGELTVVPGCSLMKVASQRHEEVAKTVGVSMHAQNGDERASIQGRALGGCALGRENQGV